MMKMKASYICQIWCRHWSLLCRLDCIFGFRIFKLLVLFFPSKIGELFLHYDFHLLQALQVSKFFYRPLLRLFLWNIIFTYWIPSPLVRISLLNFLLSAMESSFFCVWFYHTLAHLSPYLIYTGLVKMVIFLSLEDSENSKAKNYLSACFVGPDDSFSLWLLSILAVCVILGEVSWLLNEDDSWPKRPRLWVYLLSAPLFLPFHSQVFVRLEF